MRTTQWSPLAVLGLLALGPFPCVSAQTPDRTRQSEPKDSVDRSKPDAKPPMGPTDHPPELERLELWVGNWTVVENHFSPNGEIVATAKGIEEITWLLNGRVLHRVYRSGSDSQPYTALGMLTWNALDRIYQGAWFDNCSESGPAVLNGKWKEESKALETKVLFGNQERPNKQCHVVERFLDEQRRVATTYLSSSGQLVKTLEVQYLRTTPCPAQLRPIMDEIRPR